MTFIPCLPFYVFVRTENDALPQWVFVRKTAARKRGTAKPLRCAARSLANVPNRKRPLYYEAKMLACKGIFAHPSRDAAARKRGTAKPLRYAARIFCVHYNRSVRFFQVLLFVRPPAEYILFFCKKWVLSQEVLIDKFHFECYNLI